MAVFSVVGIHQVTVLVTEAPQLSNNQMAPFMGTMLLHFMKLFQAQAARLQVKSVCL